MNKSRSCCQLPGVGLVGLLGWLKVMHLKSKKPSTHSSPTATRPNICKDKWNNNIQFILPQTAHVQDEIAYSFNTHPRTDLVLCFIFLVYFYHTHIYIHRQRETYIQHIHILNYLSIHLYTVYIHTDMYVSLSLYPYIYCKYYTTHTHTHKPMHRLDFYPKLPDKTSSLFIQRYFSNLQAVMTMSNKLTAYI